VPYKSIVKVKLIIAGATVALINCGMSAIASDAQFVIDGYFESATILGKFTYRDNADGAGLIIDYYSPSLNKSLIYQVAKFDECSAMAMYQIQRRRQIVIDGSCASQGGQIYSYVYQWNDANKNWCLVREITGEKPDSSSGRVVPSEQVLRIRNCAAPGVTGPYSYESTDETHSDIKAELKIFRDSEKSKEKLNRYLDSLQSYDIYELVNYIDASNVRDVNDLAFYLSKSGKSYDSIALLEKIVENFPARTAAKLNLGDAYWSNGYKEPGAKLYRKYYDEVISFKSGRKSPARVSNRMSK
jgi:hypothetical protein